MIIGRVQEKIAPALRDHILFYEVATPVTHWRYTGNKNGSMMGARPGRKNMKNKISHYRTPVKNLILEGQFEKIQSLLESNADSSSFSFNKDIYRLIKAGKISKAEGLRFSPNPQALEMNLKGIFIKS